jgi:S1-C subfamily serine protease
MTPRATSSLTREVLVSIGDLAAPGLQDLESALAQFKPGEKVKVHYTRNGAAKTTTAQLGSLGG